MKLCLPVLLTAALLTLGLSACAAEPAEESRPAEPSAPSAVSSTAAQTTAAPFPSTGYCVADPSMHVRSQPAPYAEVIGGLAYGEQVSIVGKEGDWFRIVFRDGFAYVSAQYILGELPAGTTAGTAASTAETALSSASGTAAAD